MQYVYAINSSFTVISLLDLPLLRYILKACNLKPNYSLLGRELGYDRRTIKSHYENETPNPHRNKPSMIDKFYDIIQTLLSDDTPQQFYYERVLWQYLVDNHGLTVAYSTFRGYISKIPVFQSYFDRKHTSPSTQHTIRFETAPAEQAQIDWKENIKFLLHDGTTDRRYEKKSTIVTSNINFDEWATILHDERVANAIVDRLLHHAHVISITGDSYRLGNHMQQKE